jgi:hypothetical protein
VRGPEIVNHPDSLVEFLNRDQFPLEHHTANKLSTLVDLVLARLGHRPNVRPSRALNVEKPGYSFDGSHGWAHMAPI